MRSGQRGATFLGMVVIVLIIGLGVFAVIRLVPKYLEYLAVVRALDQTAKQGGATVKDLRTSLDRRWTVEDISSLQPKDIEIKKNGEGFTMRAFYRAETPFIGNVSLVMDFDKTVATGGATIP